MKTIGLIGGLSWESSSVYYQIINRRVQQKLGGVHSARSVMYSVDLAEIAVLQHAGEWDLLAQIMIDAAKRVERAGADFVVLCTNTMHKIANQIEQNISIPLLHIGDATAEAIVQHGCTKVGLLGTKFTMEEDFLKQRFGAKNNVQTVVPNAASRQIIHAIIYEELIKGIVSNESRNKYLAIIDELAADGAQGIVLGCTEIGLLVKPEHTAVVLFDTTKIHAEKAVDFALQT